MSTQTRHGPYGLPEVYQVYLSEDRTNCPHKEFNKIVEIAAPNCCAGGGQSGGWHKIENGNYHPQDGKYPGIPEVSYSDWKKAILREPDPVYKVGDWIVVVNDGCICSAKSLKIPDDKAYQISESDVIKHYKWSYRLKDAPRDLNAIAGNGEISKYIRHATPEEIEKATTPTNKYITPEIGKWYTCLDGYDTRPDSGGSGYKTGKVFECRDTTLFLNVSKGGSILWPKGEGHGIYNRAVREATQEEVDIATRKKKPAKDGKEWICTSEDGVELYNGDAGHFVEQRECTWRYSINCSVCKTHADKEAKGCLTTDKWKVFSTEKAAKDWIEQQNGTGWKVGDILSTKDLEKYPNYRGQNGDRRTGRSAQHFITDRYVAEVKDEWARISGTANIWLPPKHQCTPLPVEDKGWDTDSKIWYNQYSEYQKYWKPVLQSDGKYLVHVEGEEKPNSQMYTEKEITVRIKNGMWTLTKPTKPVDPVKQVPVTTSEAKKWVPKVGDWVYVLSESGDCKVGDVRKVYTAPQDGTFCLAEKGSYWIGAYQMRLATPEEIAKAQGTQIPVTAENAVIGMRVVRGKYWKGGSQDTVDGVQQIGTIVDDKKHFPTNPANRWVRVKWDYGRSDTYQIGAYDEYDLYIASDNTVTKQSINNNQSQTKTKNNDTEEKHNSKQDSSISSKPEPARINLRINPKGLNGQREDTGKGYPGSYKVNLKGVEGSY